MSTALMKTKKEIRLYNLLFPMYLLWLLPTLWLIVMPANFLIDSIVILIALSILKLPRIAIYKKTILKVWGYGFLADLIGSIFLFIISEVSYAVCAGDTLFTETIREALNDYRLAVEYNPYLNVFAFLTTILGIAISGLCIYKFNLKRTFKNIDIDLAHKKRLALLLAIVTSPYMLLIPSYALN
jgi:hypothetical protein